MSSNDKPAHRALRTAKLTRALEQVRQDAYAAGEEILVLQMQLETTNQILADTAMRLSCTKNELAALREEILYITDRLQTCRLRLRTEKVER